MNEKRILGSASLPTNSALIYDTQNICSRIVWVLCIEFIPLWACSVENIFGMKLGSLNIQISSNESQYH